MGPPSSRFKGKGNISLVSMIEEFGCLGVKHGPGFHSTVPQLCLGLTRDLHKRGAIARTVQGGRWDKNREIQRDERKRTRNITEIENGEIATC